MTFDGQGPRPGGMWSRVALAITVALGALGGTTVVADATPTPSDCATGGTCALGDTGPGGGTVFFVKGVGSFSASQLFPDPDPTCHMWMMCMDYTVAASLTPEQQAALPFDYLEVAPSSAAVDRTWSAGQQDVTGANATLLGTGAANTAAIVAATSAYDTTATSAAYYADAYAGGGETDWYLPSLDEVSLIVVTKQTLGSQMGAFGSYLWSSTQSGSSAARARGVTSGHDAYATKNGASVGVRPIRAFSADPTPPPTTVPPTTVPPTTVPPTTVPPTTEPPVTVPVPTPPPVTMPVPAPPVVPVPTPVRVGTSVGRGVVAPTALLIQDGRPVEVPLPPSAPPTGLAAAVALDSSSSIVVTPAGHVTTTNPIDDHGGLDVELNQPVVNLEVRYGQHVGAASMVAADEAPAVSGYWLVAADGGIFTFGDAGYHGSTGDVDLNASIVGMAATPSGEGYWLVASDGGVFSFGDAAFHGSTGAAAVNEALVALVATPSGHGYWLIGEDGGVFAFGDAEFHGAGSPSGAGVVGAVSSASGHGYWLIGGDGTITPFGDAGAA